MHNSSLNPIEPSGVTEGLLSMVNMGDGKHRGRVIGTVCVPCQGVVVSTE